jgi:hypothetical protein
MDDKTFKVLLDLPDEAREALKACEGSGWTIEATAAVIEGGVIRGTMVGVPRSEWPDWGPLGTWLPANPLEIVRVALERFRATSRRGAPTRNPLHHGLTEWDQSPVSDLGHAEEDGGTWSASVHDPYAGDEAFAAGDTPHLAALALLAEVWR